jgi:hypothetical protein
MCFDSPRLTDVISVNVTLIFFSRGFRCQKVKRVRALGEGETEDTHLSSKRPSEQMCRVEQRMCQL